MLQPVRLGEGVPPGHLGSVFCCKSSHSRWVVRRLLLAGQCGSAKVVSEVERGTVQKRSSSRTPSSAADSDAACLILLMHVLIRPTGIYHWTNC